MLGTANFNFDGIKFSPFNKCTTYLFFKRAVVATIVIENCRTVNAE